MPSRRSYDKRDADRIDLGGELEGEITLTQAMSVRQISAGGIRVETGFPLPLNSLHDIRLTLGERSMIVKGRIAYCQIRGVGHDGVTYSSGIEFMQNSPSTQAMIEEFLQALRNSRLSGV